jgi:hypothetical protein
MQVQRTMGFGAPKTQQNQNQSINQSLQTPYATKINNNPITDSVSFGILGTLPFSISE